MPIGPTSLMGIIFNFCVFIFKKKRGMNISTLQRNVEIKLIWKQIK